jgi:hypothetical protein
MKRTLAVLAVLGMLVGIVPARAADHHTIPVLTGFDLDGLAAADNTIFADTNVVTANTYTITAQPDACRALVATITDANSSITVGTMTVTGTDGNGVYQTATFAMSGGSGTRTIAGVWCSLISVANDTVTTIDAGTDKVRIGTTGAAGLQYPAHLGPLRQGTPVTTTLPGGNPLDAFQPFAVDGWFDSPPGRQIKTTAYSASIASFTGSAGALTMVSVGDQIQVNDTSGRPVVATIIAKASNDAATLDRSVLLTGSAGHAYRYKKLTKRSGILGGWFDVAGATGVTVFVNIKQMTGTGGIDVDVECAAGIPDVQAHPALASANVSAAGTKILQIADGPWDECRVGMKWGTGDDADATAGAEERVDVWAVLRR